MNTKALVVGQDIYILSGASNNGTVYELSRGTGGIWTETVLHRFGATGSPEGDAPQGALVLDSHGNLYGTTSEGGDSACYPQGGGCGLVYRLLRGMVTAGKLV